MRPHDHQATTETIILNSLSTLTPPQLRLLAAATATHLHRRNRRLSAILSSPVLFNQTLYHLNSLSLRRKNLLISYHLLFSLHHLTLFLPPPHLPPPPKLCHLRFHDHDAVLLVLLLCELHQHDPALLLDTPRVRWRSILSDFYLASILRFCDLGVDSFVTMVRFVENVARMLRFVNNVFLDEDGDRINGRGAAASMAAVAALPSVEVIGAVVECVVCKETIREGRDVCELPCQHLFHWMCILPWLTRTNTCPCCRFQLPSDDVFGEIGRLWNILLEARRRDTCKGQPS